MCFKEHNRNVLSFIIIILLLNLYRFIFNKKWFLSGGKPIIIYIAWNRLKLVYIIIIVSNYNHLNIWIEIAAFNNVE